jgi:hypothetical protein
MEQRALYQYTQNSGSSRFVTIANVLQEQLRSAFAHAPGFSGKNGHSMAMSRPLR